jgi:dimethylargininase
MTFTHAIARLPGPDFAQGQTTADLGAPDFERMLAQHAAYLEALRSLGLRVTLLDPLPGYPDAYFTEDVAVVMPEVTVITRPGAPTRRDEIGAIEPALTGERPTRQIEAPGTLEGGDVLVIDRQVFIGISSRTSADGARQLGEILAGYGYTWTAVPVPSGLHLKTGVTYVGEGTLFLRRDLADAPGFKAYNQLISPRGEDLAANTLLVNGTLIVPQGFPLTYRMLETLDLPLLSLDISEVQKMDGGLTCLSLRF